MELKGQQVVVVGGSSGIGWAVARLVHQKGAKVRIFGRTEATLRQVVGAFSGIDYVVGDVGIEADVQRLFADLDRVDHVYVAAGTTGISSILDSPLEPVLVTFVERVWGAIHVVRAAHGKIPAGGSITFTGGLSTDRPVPGAWVSNIGTATVEQLARALALDLAPIRFNAISPGYTDTPLWDRVAGANKVSLLQEVAAKLPVKQVAMPEEVAEAVLLLMTNRSITGESLHVDGGARLI